MNIQIYGRTTTWTGLWLDPKGCFSHIFPQVSWVLMDIQAYFPFLCEYRTISRIACNDVANLYNTGLSMKESSDLVQTVLALMLAGI